MIASSKLPPGSIENSFLGSLETTMILVFVSSTQPSVNETICLPLVFFSVYAPRSVPSRDIGAPGRFVTQWRSLGRANAVSRIAQPRALFKQSIRRSLLGIFFLGSGIISFIFCSACSCVSLERSSLRLGRARLIYGITKPILPASNTFSTAIGAAHDLPSAKRTSMIAIAEALFEQATCSGVQLLNVVRFCGAFGPSGTSHGIKANVTMSLPGASFTHPSRHCAIGRFDLFSTVKPGRPCFDGLTVTGQDMKFLTAAVFW